MKDRPQGEPLEFIWETKKDTKSGDVCSDGSSLHRWRVRFEEITDEREGLGKITP